MVAEHSLQILLVDDELVIHRTIGEYLRDSGHHVVSAHDGIAGLKSIEACDYDLALIDLKMPGADGMSLLGEIQKIRPATPVVIITGHGSMEKVIQALRLGAADFLTKPIKLLELDAVLEKSVNIRSLLLEKLNLRATIGVIQTSLENRMQKQRFVAASPAMQEVREKIRQAVEAACDTILIEGETGVGKEVVARHIHFEAGSYESPFIAVSCPALPESLVESELFGHVKGSFTGATRDRAGYFELADGGALFLDEVADLSPAAQAKLLRVLETRTIRRVGGAREINVKVRVIAATNASLEGLIESGKFRRDLYYRLNVYPIKLLPLRERVEDIIPMAEHFLWVYGIKRGLQFEGFSPEAKRSLLSCNFPGNARELRNMVERAAILCRSGRILPEHISLPKRPGGQIASSPGPAGGDQERARLLKALEDAKWNRRGAARNLGMPYSTLRYKLKALGIE